MRWRHNDVIERLPCDDVVRSRSTDELAVSFHSEQQCSMQ